MVKEKLAEIIDFFDPVELKHFKNSSFLNDENCMGKSMLINSISDALSVNSRFEIAIFCVNRFFSEPKKEKINTPQKIREELYRLKKHAPSIKIADLGNLKTGKNFNETLAALEQVCSLLLHISKNIIVIGGTQLLTSACFRAIKEFENNINFVNIDSKINLATSEQAIPERHLLNVLIDNEASHIYNISCVAYQSYFIDRSQLNRLNEQYFEHYRLGAIRNKFENIEPVLRDADLVSMNISSVRMCDAPAQTDGSPNGFYAEEACRVARYAGFGSRVKCFGLYEINAEFDQNGMTVKLAAQIFWHYIDGFLNRKHEKPGAKSTNFTKYEVQIDEIDFPIVFYRSHSSGQWWLEVKAAPIKGSTQNSVLVSCSEDDYNSACKNEIPERWWLNFKKLK